MLVHNHNSTYRTSPPFTRLLNSENFDDAKGLGNTPGLEGSSNIFSGVLDEFGEIIILEPSVGISDQAGRKNVRAV